MMAKSTDPKGAAKPAAHASMMDVFTHWQAAGLGALNWFNPTMIEKMNDMGAEWMGFVAERVREDVALQHALLHAKSPATIQQLQLQFLQKAMDQYAAETGKMIDLSARLFEDDETAAQDDDADDPSDNVNV